MDDSANIFQSEHLRTQPPLCPRCGYDVGLPSSMKGAEVIHCPECGAQWDHKVPRLTPWPGRLKIAWHLAWPCFVISLTFPCWVWYGVGMSALPVLFVLLVLLIGGGIFWPLAVASVLTERHTPELERRSATVKLVFFGVVLNLAVVLLVILITFALIYSAFLSADYP